MAGTAQTSFAFGRPVRSQVPATTLSRAGLGAAAWWACVAAAAIVLLAPLFVVDVPPILDYPNHLARMVVLADGSADPALSRMYAPHWSLIPNLGIDLFVPWLLQVLPVHVAGRVTLGVVLLVQCAGILAYHRALFRQRSLWPVASALVAYNTVYLMGFLNFLLSTGIAFFVAAGWLVFRKQRPVATSLLCSIGAIAIFFCHVFGVLFLAILVGAAEAERLLQAYRRREGVFVQAVASAGLLGLLLLPSAVLYSLSAFNGDSSPTKWLPLSSKLIGLLQPVLNYNASLDLLTAILLVAFAGLCVRHRRWKMPLSSVIAVALLLLLYAICPFTTKGGAWIDSRFVICAAFMMFAGCTPRLPRLLGSVTVLACVGLLLVRTGMVATVWAEHTTDLRQLRESIGSVAPGTRVLVVRVAPDVDPAYWATAPRSRRLMGSPTTEIHDAALLVIERHAFWPLLFANPAQQPVVVLPPYRSSAAQVGMPPDYHTLITASPADLLRAPYLADWRDHFDDVLVLDADGVPDLSKFVPGTLERLNDTGFAALYRIRPSGHPAASP